MARNLGPKLASQYSDVDKKLRVWVMGGGTAQLSPDDAILWASGVLKWATDIKREQKIVRAAKKLKVPVHIIRNLKGR